jgi:hypothetical protein
MTAGLHRFLKTAALMLPLLGACTGSAVSVSSEDYALAYDYNEFRAQSDGREFPVAIVGNPFPEFAPQDTARRLLPVMQANKPRPRLTFTLGEQSPYRLVLVFDPATGVNAAEACKGEARAGTHLAGRIVLFAVYCRNRVPLSQAIGHATAARPDDPAMGRLFGAVFQTIFSDAQISQPNPGYPGGLQ